MTIRDIVSDLEKKHKENGISINPPASEQEIQKFEKKIGFELPAYFKEFYSVCNGFECTEDIFNMLSLEDILRYGKDNGKNWFHFAEYMIFSDVWSLRTTQTFEYEIFNKGDIELVLTSSLQQFLQRFLIGNVFEKGGLYDWHEELKLT